MVFLLCARTSIKPTLKGYLTTRIPAHWKTKLNVNLKLLSYNESRGILTEHRSKNTWNKHISLATLIKFVDSHCILRKKGDFLPFSARVSLGFSPMNSCWYIPKMPLNVRITVENQNLSVKSAFQCPVLADSASLLCVYFTQFEFNPIDPGSRVLVSSPLDTRAHLPQTGGACMSCWINRRAREWPRRVVTQVHFFMYLPIHYKHFCEGSILMF